LKYGVDSLLEFFLEGEKWIHEDPFLRRKMGMEE
jgi:hypothetical protein